MKLIIALLTFIILSNCTTHSVKLGKKCTKLAGDNTYEKSIIWIVNKENVKKFVKHAIHINYLKSFSNNYYKSKFRQDLNIYNSKLDLK